MAADVMDRRFDDLLTKADLKAFMEEMTAQVKTAAEGHNANLQALRRDMKDLSKTIAARDRDLDLVLKDHGWRIRALERKRSRA